MSGLADLFIIVFGGLFLLVIFWLIGVVIVSIFQNLTRK